MSTTTIAPVKVSSRKALNRAIEQLGRIDVELERSQLARSKANARVKAKHDPPIAELERTQQQQREIIRDYVAANRAEIFGDEARVMTEAGEIAVEKLPAKTDVKSEARAVAWIKSQGRAFAKKFLSVKETPNVTAIKQAGVAVEGVEVITGREKVIITPITSGSKSTIEI